ncbi:hypothetical protein HanPI659440_Chr06g0239221 [Helianthus annuus]|nr:hypothetical protein HanPI659440_Chr06g0239221 [Helianthus annuus]
MMTLRKLTIQMRSFILSFFSTFQQPHTLVMLFSSLFRHFSNHTPCFGKPRAWNSQIAG